MITKIIAHVKSFAAEYRKDIFIALCIILVAIISFGLGRLSALREEKAPLRIETLR